MTEWGWEADSPPPTLGNQGTAVGALVQSACLVGIAGS
jgi:hypothetical protein